MHATAAVPGEQATSICPGHAPSHSDHHADLEEPGACVKLLRDPVPTYPVATPTSIAYLPTFPPTPIQPRPPHHHHLDLTRPIPACPYPNPQQVPTPNNHLSDRRHHQRPASDIASLSHGPIRTCWFEYQLSTCRHRRPRPQAISLLAHPPDLPRVPIALQPIWPPGIRGT